MSQNEQAEAAKERDRLADLKKARDRVMSLLGGGNKNGTNEKKEDKKDEKKDGE